MTRAPRGIVFYAGCFSASFGLQSWLGRFNNCFGETEVRSGGVFGGKQHWTSDAWKRVWYWLTQIFFDINCRSFHFDYQLSKDGHGCLVKPPLMPCHPLFLAPSTHARLQKAIRSKAKTAFVLQNCRPMIGNAKNGLNNNFFRCCYY